MPVLTGQRERMRTLWRLSWPAIIEQVLGTSILQLTRHCVLCSHLKVTPSFCVLPNWSMFY